MTPIHRETIDRRIAWHGTDFRSKDDIAFDLTPQHTAAIADVMSRVQGLSLLEITLKNCSHPALDSDLSRVMDEVQTGRGMVLLRGMPVGNHSLEDIERMYWIVGTHFGIGLSQNNLGQMIARIQEERLPSGVRSASGTKSAAELALHTDTAEIFSLLCVRQGQSGGETQFASALAIHNDILEKRPDVLQILYRGFPYHRRGQQPEGQPAITPYNIPVFCNVDGNVSITFVQSGILAAFAAERKTPSDTELEALSVVEETATRLQFELRFAPGEMSVVNNFTVVHARSEYADWQEPERKRLLLRLWLQAGRDRRPVVPQVKTYENAGGRHGVDAIPDRKIAANEYPDVPEHMLEIIRAAQRKRRAAAPAQ